jgi:hypothetical protein
LKRKTNGKKAKMKSGKKKNGKLKPKTELLFFFKVSSSFCKA